jgi:hypothetical protein
MAAIQRTAIGLGGSLRTRQAARDSEPSMSSGPGAHIARLAELRDEAAETALLANLLGRVPHLAVALLGATAVVALFVHASLAPLLTWLTLLGAGLIALMRAYLIMIAAPFERGPLRFFARDLQAIMLYVGFAWGAGSFLALPADVTTGQLLAFSAGAAALVALIARASDAVACFVIPAMLLSAASALNRPLQSGIFASAAILAAGLLIMGVAYLCERAQTRLPDSDLSAKPAS